MATRRTYIDLQNQDRRNFVKWTLGIGAALGLRPWNVFEVAESVIGPAAAQSMAQRATNFNVHVNFNNGGFAWMTQMIPVGTQDSFGNSLAYYKPNQAVAVNGSVKPMKMGPDSTAFMSGNKQWTAFICGQNETHSQAPNSVLRMPSGNSLISYAAALQASNPTLIPAILVGGNNTSGIFGQSQGAPALTNVPSADEFANLFAAKAGGAGFALAEQANANKYSAYYKALITLHKAANRSTFVTATNTNKSALQLLLQKLGDQLRPTNADLNRYGVDVQGTPGKLVNLAKSLITASKAFSLNLTNGVTIEAFGDDPHGAFNDMPTAISTATTLCKVWDAFMNDLNAMQDPQLAGQKIGDNIILSVSGDTPKSFGGLGVDTQNGGTDWGDGTPDNTNILYVMSNGYLKSGWFGTRTSGTTMKWNPATGADVSLNDNAVPSVNNLAQYAATAAAIAVAKGKDQPSLTAQLAGGLAGIANISQQ